ncbi:MAG: hypothetical protein V9E98_15135 [Candidatus Nanopelagicales bacterium]
MNRRTAGPGMTEPLDRLLSGEFPMPDPDVLAAHRVGLDRVLRYAEQHAYLWNPDTEESRGSVRAIADRLRLDRRSVRNVHAAALAAGRVAERPDAGRGRIKAITFPWLDVS